MTNPPPTVTYSLEEILNRFEQKMDKQFAEVNQRLDKMDDRLTKLEVGQATLSGEIKALDEKLSGEIRTIDEKLSGQIKTLDEKVEGISKRLDNQEFINRGVIVGLMVALLAGAAKAFGWLPSA